MKRGVLKIISGVLKTLAIRTIKWNKPQIIGITGSVGKTSTRNAVFAVLNAEPDIEVRAAKGSFNNELGLPLTILGDYERTGGIFFWIGVLTKEITRSVFIKKIKNYPNIIVLEYGADKPGDIDKLVEIARPNTSVITAIGETPVHIEFYNSKEDVVNEKKTLVENLRSSGTAILNADDPEVIDMAKGADIKIITFGFDKSSNVRISNFENRTEIGRPEGISLTLTAYGEEVNINIDNIIGRSHAYALAAAAAVGVVYGMRLNNIKDGLETYRGEKGRTQIIKGINDSVIIDDTYNASPPATGSALDILESLKVKRKVAILGEMLELGHYSEDAHRSVGEHIVKSADFLVTVGVRAQFIADEARKKGFPEDKIKSFDLSTDAISFVKELIKEGDVVLVKGSQGVRMEKIVKAIMAKPSMAKRLLVRQHGKWLKS